MIVDDEDATALGGGGSRPCGQGRGR
jgi:hypothetical protein